MEEKKVLEEILKEIKMHNNIICLRHINPDGDAFGSAIGLKKLIKFNFPDKNVYTTGKEIDFLKTLGEMDNINDDLFKESLVIITDTGSTQRIDEHRWEMGKKIIKIDHHPNENPYGDIQWTDSTFTSASEMIAYFAWKTKLKIDEDIAKTLLYGITTDSNRFFTKNVNSRTFDTCSFLMSPKWNIVDLFQDVYKKELSFLEAEAEVIKNMKFENYVGALFLTKEIMEKYNIPYDRNDIFTNLLQGIKDLEMWVVFSANSDGTYRVEFRSVRIPIKSVAEKYGGGGHPLIAGATIKSIDIAEYIFNDLKELAKKVKKDKVK